MTENFQLLKMMKYYQNILSIDLRYLPSGRINIETEVAMNRHQKPPTNVTTIYYYYYTKQYPQYLYRQEIEHCQLNEHKYPWQMIEFTNDISLGAEKIYIQSFIGFAFPFPFLPLLNTHR